MGCRLAGSDNANDSVIFTRGIAMYNNEDRDRTHHSQSVPTLLAVFEPIRHDDMQRVVPDFFRQFE
ncbi:hypothetical protein DSM25559_1899 [Agrobacterium rosae]|uniref:Uncharacterized protein n=1 Tax=Agrobacterium rosae TaxID=1972867 RepID=A0A1R3TJY3_9HYPH|nr:hypothetical protein DSM25559_1899 [Agrobacterium rosae]